MYVNSRWLVAVLSNKQSKFILSYKWDRDFVWKTVFPEKKAKVIMKRKNLYKFNETLICSLKYIILITSVWRAKPFLPKPLGIALVRCARNSHTFHDFVFFSLFWCFLESGRFFCLSFLLALSILSCHVMYAIKTRAVNIFHSLNANGF